MPPSAIRSSDVRAIASASRSPSRAHACSANSSSAGCGNFGAPPKPPSTGSKVRFRPSSTTRGASCGSGADPPAGSRLAIASCSRVVLLGDRRALLAIRDREPREEVEKPRAAVARFLREVGAAEERRAIGRQEHREGPAARLAGQERVRGLVDLVEVGPLLAIDLDVDVQVVHHLRDGGVLERLVRHHVAPVAGRIADRQQDRLVLALRLRERGRIPRLPVDRVVGVLAQVGTGGVGQPVRHRSGGRATRWRDATTLRTRRARSRRRAVRAGSGGICVRAPNPSSATCVPG